MGVVPLSQAERSLFFRRPFDQLRDLTVFEVHVDYRFADRSRLYDSGSEGDVVLRWSAATEAP